MPRPLLRRSLSDSGNMAVGTSVILAVVRGPVPMAKALAAIDILSDGRLVVDVGPGSSARDYEIVSLNYDERWKRFDEAIQVLRSLWSGDSIGFTGRFYSTAGIDLEPKPLQKRLHPSGSATGVQMPACAGLRDSAMDGWPRRITRCRINSLPLEQNCAASSNFSAKIRQASRTRS